MIEFIIRGSEEEDFDLSDSQLVEVLNKTGRPFHVASGFGKTNLNVGIEGCKVSFSPEPVGWQFSVLSNVDPAWASTLAEDACRGMSQVSGQGGSVLPI